MCCTVSSVVNKFTLIKLVNTLMVENNKMKTRQYFTTIVSFIFLSFYKRKQCAFKRGLETRRNVGSLLLFFDYVGLPKRKKNSALLNSLARNQTYTLTFDGANLLQAARFLPPKDLVYI